MAVTGWRCHLHEQVRVRQVGDRAPVRRSEGGRERERAAQLLGADLRGHHTEAGCLGLTGAAACISCGVDLEVKFPLGSADRIPVDNMQSVPGWQWLWSDLATASCSIVCTCNTSQQQLQHTKSPL